MNDLLKQYECRVHRHAKEQLDPYLSRLNELDDGALRNHNKEINDALWGTLEIRSLEVVFLDSPLMQRLRRIHQLGTADYVYPSATHNRLAHSLGVLNRTSLMIDSLNAAATNRKIVAPVDEATTQILRLAALMHDVGHTALSHSTENALKYLEQAREIKGEFERAKADEYETKLNTGIEVNASITEINSYFLVNSPAIADLLREAIRLTHGSISDSDVLGKIGRTIIGVPLSKHPPYLHSIISGPFDADKLDYLSRDALRAGVPDVTDSGRLFRKLRVVRARSELLPQKLREKVSASSLVTVTGVARSGNRALDEVILGRTLLYDKVYRHHGTRAAEALVAEIMTDLDESEDQSVEPLIFALKSVDMEIIGLDKWVLRRHGLRDRNRNAKAAINAAERLRNRELPVRCASFNRKMPEDPYELEPAHTLGIGRLLDELDHYPQRRQLAELIAKKISAASEQSNGELVIPPDLARRIWIDPPSALGDVGVEDAMLVGNSERIIPFDEEAPETVMWAAAYAQTRDNGFVFGPERYGPAIALSTEAVFRSKYDIRLPEIALCSGQITRDDLSVWRQRLARFGMYEDCPRDLLPLPDFLSMEDTIQRIRLACDRFRGYQGPDAERPRRGYEGLTETRIADFLAQFESSTMIDAALRAIGAFKVIGRGAIKQSVEKFISANSIYESAVIVPFGSLRDSSSPAAYFAADAEESFKDLRVDDLAGAVDRDRPILLIDDIIHSGRQAEAIVSAWFGDHLPAQALSEERRSLSAQLRKAMQDKQDQVAFLFVAGNEDGRDRLRECLKKFEMEQTIVCVSDTALPSIDDEIFESDDQAREFRQRCELIGEQLLAGDTRVSERVLGYGNHGLLLAHVYNTPAQTLTAFWKDGEVNGRKWEPLIPRRVKN